MVNVTYYLHLCFSHVSMVNARVAPASPGFISCFSQYWSLFVAGREFGCTFFFAVGKVMLCM